MKKRFKRVAALALTGILSAAMLTACGEDEYGDYDEYEEYDEESGEYYDYEEEGYGTDVNPFESQQTENDYPDEIGSTSGDGSWTIFVYLCGTDLESGGGYATGDLEEMAESERSDDVRFVIQTGGTEQWNMSGIDPGLTQRFMIQNNEISLLEEKDLLGMGQTDTLADFIGWGLGNYASEHNGLIFWDHGGGSISGVCVDEMDGCDTLSLREISDALSASVGNSKFDFIGFDACLMGTVETAGILEPYSLYMYGSEETEGGSGWDYDTIGNFLAQNPGADGAALGKVVCDSFVKESLDSDDDLVTLSIIDLSKIGAVRSAFDAFAGELCAASSDDAARASIIRAIESAENFGGNNKAEGYTNMVDMGAIISNCSAYAGSASQALSAIKDAVVYSGSGNTHHNACGLSMYYPLSYNGSMEMNIFKDISISSSYIDFLESKTDGYEGAELVVAGEETGESPYITFVNEPGFNEEGVYGFKLDTNGINAAADVYAMVYEMTPDGDAIIELGETYDIGADWETGLFTDYFDGYWLSLPDGQNLALYIADITEDSIVYSSPIYLNDRETNLRILQNYTDGTTVIEGAWDGIDENGFASREILKISEGDVITPRYFAYSAEEDSDEEFEYVGGEYTVTGDMTIYYDIMEDGDYLYAFCIDDIYGDYYITDPVGFNVEGEEISFYTE